jgi:hypothetical protein
MVGSEDLLCFLVAFGRTNIQDFIVRSSDMRDTTTYLLVERALELNRVVSYTTKDLVTFEKKVPLRYQPDQVTNHEGGENVRNPPCIGEERTR